MDAYMALCPFHDDTTRSLIVGPMGSGYVCFGCGQKGPLRELAEHFGIINRQHEYYNRELVIPHSVKSGTHGGEEARYLYRDEGGNPLFWIVRFTPKCFMAQRADGQWGIEGVRRVMYNLPALIRRKDETVIVVEGEKDVIRLHKQKILATTTPFGARAAINKCDINVLHGRVVVCIPDNDAAGYAYARQLHVALAGKADKVVTLGLYERGMGDRYKGRDVSDWLEEHTGEELKQLIKEATDGS